MLRAGCIFRIARPRSRHVRNLPTGSCVQQSASDRGGNPAVVSWDALYRAYDLHYTDNKRRHPVIALYEFKATED